MWYSSWDLQIYAHIIVTELLFMAGVAVALNQAMTPEFKAYQQQVLANCQALSSALIDLGYQIVTGRCHTCNIYQAQ